MPTIRADQTRNLLLLSFELTKQQTADLKIPASLIFRVDNRPVCTGPIGFLTNEFCRSFQTIVNAVMMPVFLRHSPRRGWVSLQTFQTLALSLLGELQPDLDDERTAVG